jgi:hypothetical protein
MIGRDEFPVGAPVVMVTDDGSRRRGEHGIITRTVEPGVLTGRPMVEVLFAGERAGIDDEGVYVQSIELVRLQAVA